jgi:hypothetical protein
VRAANTADKLLLRRRLSRLYQTDFMEQGRACVVRDAGGADAAIFL